MLDHVDQDKTNNRIKNLRETDHQSNALNTAPAKVKGVYVTGSGKYAAKCCGNYLGSFPTREEAEASYLKYRKRKMENEHAFF